MTNLLFASDLALILKDGAGMASPMAWGSFTGTGILGVASESFTTASNLAVVQGETWTVIYQLADFPGLASGQIVNFGSTRYMIRHIDRMGDGLEFKAYMEKLP